MRFLIIPALVVVLIVLVAARSARAELEVSAEHEPTARPPLGSSPRPTASAHDSSAWGRPDPAHAFVSGVPIVEHVPTEHTLLVPVGPTVGQIALGVALGMWIFVVTSAAIGLGLTALFFKAALD